MNDIFRPRRDEPADRYRSAEPDRLKDAPKRFYERVEVVRGGPTFEVRLDDRPVRTPGRSPLALATERSARLVADEWAAQGERIDPTTMPATRLANTAIDGVANEMQAVRDDVVRYVGSDLLCYRAEEPEGLVAAEARAWDPHLDWAARHLGANFVLGQGIVPVQQPREAIARFARHVANIDDPFRLAGLHVMTALTGSAILALEVLEEALDPGEAWAAAHVEEDWNVRLWGADEEASARRAAREIEMRTAAAFAVG